MAGGNGLWGALGTLFSCFFDVAFFWQVRLWQWWTTASPKQILRDQLAEARYFEEWNAAAYSLDDLEENSLWRQNMTSKHYDYRLIYDRLQCIIDSMESNDLLSLIDIIRSGLVRNLGNITAPRLYSRAYAGTKLLIEDYTTQVALAVGYIAHAPSSPDSDFELASQTRLSLLHDSRQAFGRSVLVLQGGSIFGLCHIGVVKALLLRGVLPRIISGTSTGALIAALVAVHPDHELLDFLSSSGIDLSAFNVRSKEAAAETSRQPIKHGIVSIFLKRCHRFITEGYLLDSAALEECVKVNVGNLTFAEAYNKTKRILNITISNPTGGVPELLNYLTAPHVLIWSAALASNRPSDFRKPTELWCKDENGQVAPYSTPYETTFKYAGRPKFGSERESPLARVGELFNVNHFIVSQARPYVAPFLQSELGSPKPGYTGRRSMKARLFKIAYMEIQHRLRQADSFGYLSGSNQRFLLDEVVPGPSLTLVPAVNMYDFLKLLENPTKQMLDYWILKGEKSVWPAIGALKIRMAIEVELDRAYQLVRRKKPFDPRSSEQSAPSGHQLEERPRKQRKRTARSADIGG